MRARIAEQDQMTIEEFLAFTAERPDEERWELIEGMAFMNASPTDFHQIIAGNIKTAHSILRRKQRAKWIPLIGTGTRVPVSPRSLPQPDVMVKERPATGSPVSDEALVLFEVISTSNTFIDQAWRRRVYASVPNCQHYVTVSQNKVLVVRNDRANAWQPVEIEDISANLRLPALGVSIDLAEIYADTPHAP